MPRHQVNHLIEKHYLYKWPRVVVAILGLFLEEVPIGVVVFSLPPREIKVRYEAHCWELGRLFIEDLTPKNTETWFVARAIKWVQANRPDVKCLVSYADPTVGHQGIIYKAGNWISDGNTGRPSGYFDYAHPETGKKYSRASHIPEGVKAIRIPRTVKFRYVYWLDGTHEKKRQAAMH